MVRASRLIGDARLVALELAVVDRVMQAAGTPPTHLQPEHLSA